MKRVILKCDDFWASDFRRQFRDVFASAQAHGVKLSVGLIGCSLERKADYTKIKEYIENKTIELFSHSYWHFMEQNGDKREYLGMDEAYQRISIDQTNEIAKRVLDVNISTIGFPANACDNLTLRILIDNEQIKNIYHVAGSYNSHKISQINKRIINIDHSIFEKRNDKGDLKIDHDAVMWHFDNTPNDLVVFQMHPGAWNVEEIHEFERTIRSLKNKQAEFIFPSDL